MSSFHALEDRIEDGLQPVYPPEASFQPSPWQPIHTNDPPEPPPQDTREADLAALAAQEKLGHDGKRQRVRPRRTVDPFGGLERWKIFRTTRTSIHDQLFMRTNPAYLISLLPPSAYTNTSTSLCTRYAHTSTNKIRCPVNIVKWTPDARRVLTGSTSGEFTLWNGLTFNFETILQAHDTAVRAMEWSYSGQWLISSDNNGVIKYFQANMNNLQIFQGHQESIRDMTWAPNDQRFATGSDDGTIKIWNFETMKEEKTLTGHGWDVKCVKWHPTKGLLVSGSKDNLIKFWDPRTSRVLTTLHGHKNTVQACAWSPSGNLVATASRDQLVKVFDIRAMKELVTLRGHKKEVCSIAWHPIHDDLLVSGGSEGSIIHWSMPDLALKEHLEFAHDSNVWSLAFHPLGHLLCSASNDHMTRFWSRARPGQRVLGDRFHLGKDRARELGAKEEDEEEDFVPGLNSFGRGGGGGGGGGFNNNNRNSSGPNTSTFRPSPFMQAPPIDTSFIPGFGRGHDELPGFVGSNPPPQLANIGGGPAWSNPGSNGSGNNTPNAYNRPSPLNGGQGNFGLPSQFGNPGPSQFGNSGPPQFGNAGPQQFGNSGPPQFGKSGPSQFGNAGPLQFGNAGPAQFGNGGPNGLDNFGGGGGNGGGGGGVRRGAPLPSQQDALNQFGGPPQENRWRGQQGGGGGNNNRGGNRF